MFIPLHAVDYKLGDLVGSAAREVGQVSAAEAPVVIHVVFASVDSGDKLLRVAEYAVGELIEELDVQAVVVKIVLVVEKVKVHGLAQKRGLDRYGRIVGYDAVAHRQNR